MHNACINARFEVLRENNAKVAQNPAKIVCDQSFGSVSGNLKIRLD